MEAFLSIGASEDRNGAGGCFVHSGPRQGGFAHLQREAGTSMLLYPLSSNPKLSAPLTFSCDPAWALPLMIQLSKTDFHLFWASRQLPGPLHLSDP